MKRIVCAIASVALAAGQAAARTARDEQLAYRFRLLPAVQPTVRIELTTTGSDSGVTWFEVSRQWGGVVFGGDDLSAVSAASTDGRPLVVTRPERNRWRVAHPPGITLRIAYEIAPNDHQDESAPAMHRRPIVNERLFHCYGELGLLRPAFADPSRRYRVRVGWEGFDALGWEVASSFGVGGRPLSFTTTLADLLSSVWVAGDLELVRRDVRGRPLWIAAQRAEWTFQLDQFADLAERVVGMERAFFRDFDAPYYLISLIPVGRADTRSRSVGGTGLTDSFSLCMLSDTPLRSDLGQGQDIAMLLAHEMFHHWNGQALRPAQPEQLCYWFTEGFTEFYTRRLLYRNGLIELDVYAQAATQALAELWTSTVRNQPNTVIAADFWTNAAVQRLPYLRGDVVAMIVDHGIRARSRGRQSLDDLMRQLVRDARRHGGALTSEGLFARFETQTGRELAQQVRAVVVDGATPVLPADLLAPCLRLVEQEVFGYALGFDFQRTRDGGVVAGVVPGSAAEQAGLRDGMKIARWNVRFGDTSQPTELTIIEEGQTREIRFLPRGPAVVAPRLEAASVPAASTCSGP